MEIEPGKHTYREIMSQGDVWQATLASLEQPSTRVLELLHQPYGEVIFTGCGSTYYLSLAAASIWQSITGIRARGVPASELWLFPHSLLSNQPTLLVAVSRSGETSETLRALDGFAGRPGGEILAISAYADSQLARRCAPALLLTQNAEEESVAQTRSFSSMFMLAQAAACLAAGDANGLSALRAMRALPASFQPLVERYEPLSRSLAQDPGLERFIFLGSGPNYGLACEAMLKMKEMSLSPSEAFHFMEFRHGPKSVVAPGTLLVGLLSDSAGEQEMRVLEEMRALGATVLALVDMDRGLSADHIVELRSGLPELQRGALMLPLLQLLAFYRARSKGLNPDRPTNLEAVVRL